MNIGKAIEALRTEAGFNQLELSRKTGISQTSLSLLENGGTLPRQNSLDKISKALNIPISLIYLYALEDAISLNDYYTNPAYKNKMKGLIYKLVSKL